MTDPIDMLEGLPPETPPREVVLASLRLFRYRASLAILVVVAVVLGLAYAARTAGGPQLDSETRAILQDSQVEFRPVSGTALIGPVQVTVTEVAMSAAGNAARVVFVDIGATEPEVDLEVVAIRQGSQTVGPNLSIQPLGRNEGRTSTAVWVPLDPTMDPIGAAIEIFALPIPQSILDEGGELSSDEGHTGVVTIERTPNP